MTLGISWGVAVHRLLHAGIRIPYVRALGMANIAVGGLLHIPSCLLQGASLIVCVYIYSFGNMDIWLRLLVGRVAVCLLSSSICLGYMSSGLVSCCFWFQSILPEFSDTICCHTLHWSSRREASCASPYEGSLESQTQT